MAIREDLVASAAKFLQDPSVASSPVENRIAFLQAKNMTPEEVSAAMARAGQDSGAAMALYPAPASGAPPPGASQPAQGQPYYGRYPSYAWQPPPPEPPRRDWRDWFIMATVVGGVSYGLFSLTKRYIYPLVAPPTPERLEQDKKSIDEQFEKAFTLVDQLAKDTEALKAAEAERTERLDGALSDLESVINELKTANRRRDQEIQRHRDDVQGLRDQFPKALESHKEMTDSRLKEVNAELKSLKALISQRMNSNNAATTPAPASGAAGSNYLRPSSGNATPAPTSSSPAPPMAASVTPAPENDENNGTTSTAEPSKTRDYQGYVASLSRNSPAPGAAGPKASIPAWQMSMQSKGSSSSAAGSSSGAVQESSSSS